MSLVGSLEDLSLGDILQIISLSQKSGVLALKTTGCDGRIVFVKGLVRGAGIKGGPHDLRGVLVDGGFLSDDEFTAAVQHAEQRGAGVAVAVTEISSLTHERVDSLCREAIEAAVVEMFSWQTGDFSFDVRNEPEANDPELLLPTGINAQYLALEAARVKDEDEQDGEADCADIDEMSAHDFFGVSEEAAGEGDDTTEFDESPATSAEDAVETLAMATAQRTTDVAGTLAEGDLITPEPLPDVASEPEAPFTEEVAQERVEDISEAEFLESHEDEGEVAAAVSIEDLPADDSHEAIPAAERLPAEEVMDLDTREPIDEVEPGISAARPVCLPAPGEGASQRPLIALDGELSALEWVKAAVQQDFAPVHIFQHSDQALQRVRQYLVRGRPPVILISPDIQVDHLGGIRDSVDFVARLKSQSAKAPVLWLCTEGGGGCARMGAADGVMTRPDDTRLHAGRSPEELEELAVEFAQKLRIDVESAASAEITKAATRSKGVSPDAIRKLRDTTRALTEASSRGEVLPLVIRFASEVFGRVAMFMVRDERAVGMAGRGLERAGGPDDAGLREICINPNESVWMSGVLEHGKPIQGTVDCDCDRMLVALLGDRPPQSIYMAPIESTGQVIALLYGDNLPDDDCIGDTSALEVVLHHAGLALDRAALERALREDDS
ncbi:MAG: DUF4388 domain-containing protein [Deltaproteobacteria bacterium]|nr:DUF4388 domain-containing protein [Deltaproteobacteria bacterium]MBW2698153.1 DUF4388 domain-containing protein [Deltaproteobacteria bacterium]